MSQHHHKIIDTDFVSLVEVSDTWPGYTRKIRGRGWSYYDADTLIKDKHIRKRIKNLKLIPSWENAWICKIPGGHLQTTGYDSIEQNKNTHTSKYPTKEEKLLINVLDVVIAQS